MNVPAIVDKINDLYPVLKKTCNAADVANKINSILIYGDGVPSNLLSVAWRQFAHQRGVKNE